MCASTLLKSNCKYMTGTLIEAVECIYNFFLQNMPNMILISRTKSKYENVIYNFIFDHPVGVIPILMYGTCCGFTGVGCDRFCNEKCAFAYALISCIYMNAKLYCGVSAAIHNVTCRITSI